MEVTVFLEFGLQVFKLENFLVANKSPEGSAPDRELKVEHNNCLQVYKLEFLLVDNVPPEGSAPDRELTVEHNTCLKSAAQQQ